MRHCRKVHIIFDWHTHLLQRQVILHVLLLHLLMEVSYLLKQDVRSAITKRFWQRFNNAIRMLNCVEKELRAYHQNSISPSQCPTKVAKAVKNFSICFISEWYLPVNGLQHCLKCVECLKRAAGKHNCGNRLKVGWFLSWSFISNVNRRSTRAKFDSSWGFGR